MSAHYDAAGAGLNRFQPIVTPDSYPGEHYDSNSGITLTTEDKKGFSDRFWDRGDSLHSSTSRMPLHDAKDSANASRIWKSRSLFTRDF
jgi:hypothetical protein